MLIGSALIEGVEGTNVAVVHLNQLAVFISRQDLYAMNVDHGRNCYKGPSSLVVSITEDLVRALE